MIRPTRLLTVLSIVLIGPLSAPAANHGRFLPTEPGIPPGSLKWTHADNDLSIEYNFDAIVGTDKVGVFRFTFDTYLDNVTAPQQPADGGAGMAGGFGLDPGFKLTPGFELSIVQTVIATKSGDNEWMAPDGTEFPDSADPQGFRPARSSPEYALQRLFPDVMGNPGADLRPLFSDIPLRRFADGDQFWRAELGLVGVDRTNKEVRVIANVLWGFDVHAATKTISPRSPIPLQNPTTQYMDTLTRYFDNNANNQPGKPSTVVWTFNRNMALMAVPEPSPLAMVVPAAAFLMFAKLKRAAA